MNFVLDWTRRRSRRPLRWRTDYRGTGTGDRRRIYGDGVTRSVISMTFKSQLLIHDKLGMLMEGNK